MMRNNGRILIIGITGNSGSGKSLIAGMCSEFGAYVINADEINHENMVVGKPAYDEIVGIFGADVLDESGAIDRRRLGAKVFDDKEQLRILVDITHKHVIAETLRRIAETTASPRDYRFIIIDAPLLIEAGMHEHCDEVWLVTADYETRLARVRSRDLLSDEHIAKRFASGASPSELAKHSHVVIENNFENQHALKEYVSSLLVKRGIICQRSKK